MIDDVLKRIQKRMEKQESCEHEYRELQDAFDGSGLNVFFCDKCKGLKHELERWLNE